MPCELINLLLLFSRIEFVWELPVFRVGYVENRATTEEMLSFPGI